MVVEKCVFPIEVCKPQNCSFRLIFEMHVDDTEIEKTTSQK